jgi:hypothetical protein
MLCPGIEGNAPDPEVLTGLPPVFPEEFLPEFFSIGMAEEKQLGKTTGYGLDRFNIFREQINLFWFILFVEIDL